MKQFLFLLSACVCPGGFLSAVSADESQPIALTADEIVIRLGGHGDENSALATTVDDSKTKVHMNGKIVVIGPDGKHQEFAISGNEAGKFAVLKPLASGRAHYDLGPVPAALIS